MTFCVEGFRFARTDIQLCRGPDSIVTSRKNTPSKAACSYGAGSGSLSNSIAAALEATSINDRGMADVERSQRLGRADVGELGAVHGRVKTVHISSRVRVI